MEGGRKWKKEVRRKNTCAGSWPPASYACALSSRSHGQVGITKCRKKYLEMGSPPQVPTNPTQEVGSLDAS